MADLPDTSFWRFSVAFYARPEAAAACLALQDRHGCDVNLLLLALWLAHQGHGLSVADGQRLRRLARDWQHPVIRPLRQVRRTLKQRLAGQNVAWPEALAEIRHRLAAVEIALEKTEQLLLERAVGEPVPARADPATARRNFLALGMAIADTVDGKRLLALAFPGASS